VISYAITRFPPNYQSPMLRAQAQSVKALAQLSIQRIAL
jgi:predicted PP-loop superfamily ATPase